ncbi:helix-turn-helix transcriptional regulator [Sphingosinithalassobacter portus]|uniref:helix-turn-helix transcriptional regulator n=1 Tax=Stakelama portus TaxID=2676234 RepID=UPI000D6E447E|nr:LuxR C-terminal-related transcriptional regulator [Sphingosinithalassobacter portus]
MPETTGKRRFGLSFFSSVALFPVQLVAAIYVLVDGLDEAFGAFSLASLLEALVAVALVAGIVINALYLRRVLARARRREAALALARGAFAEAIAMRFDEWKLSAAESEVAMFALKGCSVAEIASMRAAAAGTVRSQLSQIYAKAGVGSQSALVSLFIDDLLQ